MSKFLSYKFLKYNGLWFFYFAFAAGVIATHSSEPIFSTAGPLGFSFIA